MMDVHPSCSEGLFGMCIMFPEEIDYTASSIVTDEARGTPARCREG